ncbi:hypothetical protein LAZ67_1004796 [Cordylochernes scorpioides]|uniref:Mos1 transposase HTH domain-containing protein n=1 Tax=Cordylochernes scorpioides TaxID=51811 RepID=A0ABY6JZG7_9ARAC|nr:hypothetical protein LAZ67_1004796 [Cordylochernes scorpioides]
MESVTDEKRVERPILHRNPEKVSQISNLIKENPQIGLRDIEEKTGISKSLVGSIIKEDLQLKKTPSKFVPKMLTIQQKENRVEVKMVVENHNWKEKVITGDEPWVYGYDPETKRQSMEWKGKDEPRTKKSRLCKSKNKVLLVTFFDIKGIVHYEYLEKVFWIVFDFYLLKKMDQRTCIKFCVKNEIKCADAFRMLTVGYGEATLDRSNVYRWYKMFSEGREDVNGEERAGRPSTSTTNEKINEVEKMILANRRITVREVAEDLNISIGSCHSIFINDLGMRRVAAKFVPKLLNCDQKQHRMNIANEMLDSVRDDPNLFQRVITGDEAWVYGYDVETKAQSSQWKLPHEPRPKKSAPSSVECESFADTLRVPDARALQQQTKKLMKWRK